MAGRVDAVTRHLLAPQACAAPAAQPARPKDAGYESPTGRDYPAGTPLSLKGNMEPVSKEVEGALVVVRGKLPADLDGQFIRNGPNPALDYYGKGTYHEFTGDGMLHACDLRGGSGTYRNRWTRTVKKVREEQLRRPLKFPEEAMGPDGVMNGTANTALVYHANKLLALEESDRPYVISLPELETMGQLTQGLTHNVTAHPKVCPVTGEMMFFGYSLFEPVVRYNVASPEGKMKGAVEVPTCGGKPVMMHDMAITEKYSILLEFPLYFEMSVAMKGGMPYIHDDKLPSMFGVMPRHATSHEQVRWFKGASAMSFHIANAWEEGDKIKMLGCPQDKFSFDYWQSRPSRLREWTFDLSTGATSERNLDSTHIEFPVINPRLTGRKSRYMWAAVFNGAQSPFHSICGCIKYDLATGKQIRHDFLDNRWGGESVFAARSNAAGADEDDGYLITYTFNPADKTTELYVVDARTMAPEPVAILRTPQRVPFGFHAFWLPRQAGQ